MLMRGKHPMMMMMLMKAAPEVINQLLKINLLTSIERKRSKSYSLKGFQFKQYIIKNKIQDIFTVFQQ